ncbi:MAG: ABC transporter substrate-binding protein [Reyranellaceae bacterium]
MLYAQQMPIVGFLNSASAEGYTPMANAFKRGLEEAGYVEGKNVAIEYRWADDRYDRLPALATELVARQVSVIFVNSPAIAAAQAATKTIPISFVSGGDPVQLGFVGSLNRPGGNTTGIAILSGELASKRLALLSELVPNSKTIACLVNADFGPSGGFRSKVEAAASVLGLSMRFLAASSDREIEVAFDILNRERPDAVLIGPGPFLDSRRSLLTNLASRTAIPAAYETRASAVAGGLMSYGADVGDGYRQAGYYTGRILKGEKPAALPVIQATKLDMVINLKTAKALGINISTKMLVLADDVIE